MLVLGVFGETVVSHGVISQGSSFALGFHFGIVGRSGYCVRRSTRGLEEGREADFALNVLGRLVDLELRLCLLAGVLCGTLARLLGLGSLCVRTWRSAVSDQAIRVGEVEMGVGMGTYVAATHFEDCSGICGCL